MSKLSRAIIPYMRKSKFNYRKQLDNGGGALHSYRKIGEKPLCMAQYKSYTTVSSEKYSSEGIPLLNKCQLV